MHACRKDTFFGRDELLDRLENSLKSDSSGKCIVIFGQKRAGKSSVLEHLYRRLRGKEFYIPIRFSVQELGRELTEQTFFYKIVQGTRETLRSLRTDLRGCSMADIIFLGPA